MKLWLIPVYHSKWNCNVLRYGITGTIISCGRRKNHKGHHALVDDDNELVAYW